MKVLAFGRRGQVAAELNRLGIETLGRDSVNFQHPEAVADYARTAQADAFINAAAYTAVDKAEDEADSATRINGTSVAALAQVAAERGLPLVHISSDYVLNGQGSAPITPDAATGPLNTYGHSKLAGEQGVQAAGGTYAILRTSWVFSPHGSNFVKTMLRLGAERDSLSVVADQVGGPTPAAEIAAACVAIARQLTAAPEKSGIYHFAGAPDVSWAGFAREIFAQAGLDCQVHDIATAQYPTPARRPLNSRLDCSQTETVFGLPCPDWRSGLAKVLKELHV